MKKKKLLSIFAGVFAVGALCLVPTLITEAASSHKFSDIKKGNLVKNVSHLYYEKGKEDYNELDNAANALSEAGAISGYNNNSVYGVDKQNLRVDWITALWGMAGKPHENTDYFYEIFPDIKYDLRYDNTGNFQEHTNYYTIPAVWGCKMKVMIGYGTTGEFGAADGIYRKDAITAAYQYYKSKYNKTDGAMPTVSNANYSNFSEVDSTAQQSVKWALYEGILDDSQGGSFKPKEVIKRDEGLIILYRLLNVTKEAGWSNGHK